MLETLDYTIRIGSTPTFLYFDLYLYSVYAAHYVYFKLAALISQISRNSSPYGGRGGRVYYIGKLDVGDAYTPRSKVYNRLISFMRKFDIRYLTKK